MNPIAALRVVAMADADATAWRPSHNPWVIAVVVALAAFMEILDTSIANVALPHIAGSLGVTNDESTWVLTSYLVSNAIVLPVSGWIAGAVGRKRFFVTCVVLFTISSLLCGIAPSLGLLILFRILQGSGGGGLQPMAQAIMADIFPPTQRGLAFRCTASPRSSGQRSDQHSAGGLPTTTPGAGSSISTCPSAS